MGVQDVCASIELRMNRIAELGRVLPSGAIVYGRLPMMLYRVCPIRSQEGCRKRDCFLTDRTGRKFPLLCSGDYQELVNAEILWLAGKEIPLEWQDFYFTDETPGRITEILTAYQNSSGHAPEGRTSGLYYRGLGG
jgi:putative protease